MRQIVAPQKHGGPEGRPDGNDRQAIAQHKTQFRPRRQLRDAPIRHTVRSQLTTQPLRLRKRLDSATRSTVRFFFDIDGIGGVVRDWNRDKRKCQSVDSVSIAAKFDTGLDILQPPKFHLISHFRLIGLWSPPCLCYGCEEFQLKRTPCQPPSKRHCISNCQKFPYCPASEPLTPGALKRVMLIAS